MVDSAGIFHLDARMTLKLNDESNTYAYLQYMGIGKFGAVDNFYLCVLSVNVTEDFYMCTDIVSTGGLKLIPPITTS